MPDLEVSMAWESTTGHGTPCLQYMAQYIHSLCVQVKSFKIKGKVGTCEAHKTKNTWESNWKNTLQNVQPIVFLSQTWSLGLAMICWYDLDMRWGRTAEPMDAVRSGAPLSGLDRLDAVNYKKLLFKVFTVHVCLNMNNWLRWSENLTLTVNIWWPECTVLYWKLIRKNCCNKKHQRMNIRQLDNLTRRPNSQ